MKVSEITLTFFLLLVLAFGLSNCTNSSPEQSKKKTATSELLPPPPTHQPSRPSRPAPSSDRVPVREVPTSSAFASHPRLEVIIDLPQNDHLFQFNFDQPGEMAPPRQVMFSGVLNTTLTEADFPAFKLDIWSNDPGDSEPVFSSQLTFEQETQGTFSFQLMTPNPLAPGLYYYLVKGEDGKRLYANKVIVDY